MAGKPRGVYVTLKDPINLRDDPTERATRLLRKFNRKVKDEKIIFEAKQRRFYEKKSDRLRRKKNAAKLRMKYQLLEEQGNQY